MISSPDGLEWRRSKACNGGHCVEVARDGSVIKIRSSAEPDGASIAFNAKEWQGFVAQIRAGRFGVT